MLVTLKNLQQQTFQIEIAATDSVSSNFLSVDDTYFEQVKVLKEKIESTKGESYKASEQKLIYAGKILGKTKNPVGKW